MFPERQYQNGLAVSLEILYRNRNTAVQKNVRNIYVIVSSSLFLKETRLI